MLRNSIGHAKPGDLILYGSDFDTAWRIGRFVSASAMMFRVEPWDRAWHSPSDPYSWTKATQMGKGKFRRLIPAEVWNGDDAFAEKLRLALLDSGRTYEIARRNLRDEYVRDRDALIDSVGAIPK